MLQISKSILHHISGNQFPFTDWLISGAASCSNGPTWTNKQ